MHPEMQAIAFSIVALIGKVEPGLTARLASSNVLVSCCCFTWCAPELICCYIITTNKAIAWFTCCILLMKC